MARKRLASGARGLSWFLWVRTATNNVSWKASPNFYSNGVFSSLLFITLSCQILKSFNHTTFCLFCCIPTSLRFFSCDFYIVHSSIYIFICHKVTNQFWYFQVVYIISLIFLRKVSECWGNYHWGHIGCCHADFADCQLIYLCSSVSLRLTKTDINPLKRMGRCPAVMLPLYSYKSKLLSPKPKAWHNLLPVGLHPLQGDKQEINLFNDNRDNRNNGKNGRNVVCHEVT